MVIVKGGLPMKKYKRILSTVSIFTLCMLMVLTSIPFVSAASKPKAPTNLIYDCPEAIDGANILFKKPSGTISGYNIVVKDYNGKIKYNKTFKSSLFSKITLDGAAYKGYFWYENDGISKIIKAGQWYTIKMRAYRTSGGKKIFSSWSKATYGACDVTGMKAKRSGTTIKISWNKMKGVSLKNAKYHLDISYSGKNAKILTYKDVKSNSLTVKSVPKSVKKINALITCYKKANGKYIKSDTTSSYHTLKI